MHRPQADPSSHTGAPPREAWAFPELERVLEATDIGVWEWDAAGDEVWWSANIGPLYGLPRGAAPASLADYLELIPPDFRPAVEATVRSALERGEDYDTEYPTMDADGNERWLYSKAHLITDDDGRVLRVVGTKQDITERKLREIRDSFLAESAVALSRSLDYQETLEQIGGLIVPRLADWFAVNLLRGDELETVTVHHVDPDRVRFAQDLRDRYPPRLDLEQGTGKVIRTGEPELIREIPEELLGAAAEDEEHLALLKGLGLRSAVTVPLTVGEHTFGAITLVNAESGRLFDERDVTVAGRFAIHVAFAIENSRLHSEERQARQLAERAAARIGLLQALTSELSDALTPTDVANVVVRELGALGADSGAVYRLDASRGVLRRLAGASRQAESERYATISLDEDLPICQVARTGEPLFLRSISDDPRLKAIEAEIGPGSLAVLPLVPQGEVLGVVAITSPEVGGFEAADRSFASAVASQCGQAMARAIAYEREHQAAETLQRAMLPSRLPDVEGLELAAEYVPGAPRVDVGGDWYDVIRVPGGRLGIAVGDVMGRGIGAAALMGQLRNALRANLLRGDSPAHALDYLNRLVEELEERPFATVFCAVLDPATGRGIAASAGHLPAILIGDETGFVEPPGCPPLGVGADVDFHEGPIEVPPGATLLFYTDGLVEDRRTLLDAGMDRLASVSPPAPGGVAEWLREVIQMLTGDREHADDIAVLALRREG